MTTNTADARLRRRFQMLDLDGNGLLEADDFSQLAHRVTAAVGADPASPRAQALLAGTARYWEGVREDADANRDGQVTLEEYMAAVHDAGVFERYVRTYAETQTDLVDVNEDGYVERADFIACLEAVGFTNEEAAHIYSEVDTEDAGRVFNEAFVASIARFYTSDDAVEFDRAT
ncbi:MAG: EF-hand domain-containing protein [Pseudonocardiaceae bacterium]